MSFITKVFSALDFGLWHMWFLLSCVCMAQSFHTDKYNYHITGGNLKIGLPEFLSKLTAGETPLLFNSNLAKYWLIHIQTKPFSTCVQQRSSLSDEMLPFQQSTIYKPSVLCLLSMSDFTLRFLKQIIYLY